MPGSGVKTHLLDTKYDRDGNVIEVELSWEAYSCVFMQVAGVVRMVGAVKDGKHRGNVFVPEPYFSQMRNEAKAILKGRKSRESDCGW